MTLVDFEDNPIPPDVSAGHFDTPAESRLRYAVWRPESSLQKGTVCILQGRAEFLEKYFETARDLVVRGFAVAMFDWRGQGGSLRQRKARHKGHVDDFAEYVADLDAFMTQVVLPNCPPPFYGLAHSTGATVLLLASPSLRNRFRRNVCLAPLLGFGDTGWPQEVVAPLSRVLAAVGLKRSLIPGASRHRLYDRPFEENRLTSDPRRYRRNIGIAKAHPELTVDAPTIGWVRAAVDAMGELDDVDYVEKIRIPTLLVAAGADRIVSNVAIERLARTLKASHLVVIPGARHELLQESDVYREQALAAFDAFVPGS
ncbi:alpha/beta hydrolase [Prosthecomicrobium sp. N25]|uniref:alpha/beta hydrolase n=1 Tax=Prosthecomicrobium sp. N25 TaxID=3129254 RepID=UPI00307884B0